MDSSPQTSAAKARSFVAIGPGAAYDFLGLDTELQARASHVVAPPEVPPEFAAPEAPPAPFPIQETLRADEALTAHWPEVRPNAWRIAPPEARPEAGTPSWLLQLDDAHLPLPAVPAHLRLARPAATSFQEDGAPLAGASPWILRGLVAVAALCLCGAILQAFRAPAAVAPPQFEPTVRPARPAESAPALDLLTPEEAEALQRLENAARPAPAVRPAPAARADTVSTAVPLPRLGEPAVATAREMAEADPVPAAVEDGAPPPALSAAARERLERWLLQHSTASAPLADLGTIVAAPAASGIARGASAGEPAIAGVWEGATIPIETLDGKLILSTPAVGRVRARVGRADAIEGRLVAIGGSRLWIETPTGRVVLDSARITALEQVAETPAAAGRVARDGGSDRVRVRTAGGVFFGRVVERQGARVTLVTDEGARLTVDADDISPAPVIQPKPSPGG